jgi:hypothetical protein
MWQGNGEACHCGCAAIASSLKTLKASRRGRRTLLVHPPDDFHAMKTPRKTPRSTYFPQLNSSNQAQIERYSGLQGIKEAHPMGEK